VLQTHVVWVGKNPARQRHFAELPDHLCGLGLQNRIGVTSLKSLAPEGSRVLSRTGLGPESGGPNPSSGYSQKPGKSGIDTVACVLPPTEGAVVWASADVAAAPANVIVKRNCGPKVSDGDADPQAIPLQFVQVRAAKSTTGPTLPRPASD
jgi:hypothetical protein